MNTLRDRGIGSTGVRGLLEAMPRVVMASGIATLGALDTILILASMLLFTGTPTWFTVMALVGAGVSVSAAGYVCWKVQTLVSRL